MINDKKSEVTPAQVLLEFLGIEFLGIGINTKRMISFSPSSKIEMISKRCASSRESDVISLRDLASLLGLLNWTAMALGYEQQAKHINELELIAAFNSLRSFAASSVNCSVELKLDNTTAVSYINRQSGCKSQDLCAVALKMAEWCETRSIGLHAVYLPGTLNFIADRESRRALNPGD